MPIASLAVFATTVKSFAASVVFLSSIVFKINSRVVSSWSRFFSKRAVGGKAALALSTLAREGKGEGGS
jgi:hypothetical protein